MSEPMAPSRLARRIWIDSLEAAREDVAAELEVSADSGPAKFRITRALQAASAAASSGNGRTAT